MHTSILLSTAEHLFHIAPVPEVVAAPKSIPEVIDGLRLWLMSILFAYATLCMVIGFLRYTGAGDNTQMSEQAKGNFRAAALGYAGAVLSPVILEVIKGIIGG